MPPIQPPQTFSRGDSVFLDIAVSSSGFCSLPARVTKVNCIATLRTLESRHVRKPCGDILTLPAGAEFAVVCDSIEEANALPLHYDLSRHVFGDEHLVVDLLAETDEDRWTWIDGAAVPCEYSSARYVYTVIGSYPPVISHAKSHCNFAGPPDAAEVDRTWDAGEGSRLEVYPSCAAESLRPR